jgi:hypothetical protein
VLADAGDLFGDGPDHVLGAGILLELAVQAELQLQVVLMDEAGGTMTGPSGTGRVRLPLAIVGLGELGPD